MALHIHVRSQRIPVLTCRLSLCFVFYKLHRCTRIRQNRRDLSLSPGAAVVSGQWGTEASEKRPAFSLSPTLWMPRRTWLSPALLTPVFFPEWESQCLHTPGPQSCLWLLHPCGDAVPATEGSQLPHAAQGRGVQLLALLSSGQAFWSMARPCLPRL